MGRRIQGTVRRNIPASKRNCFEASIPDSPSPLLPSVVLKPGETYTQTTIYKSELKISETIIDKQILKNKLSNDSKTQPNYTFALTVVIIVCFLIGFVTTMNNSMIGFCKTVFNLTEAQGQLVTPLLWSLCLVYSLCSYDEQDWL